MLLFECGTINGHQRFKKINKGSVGRCGDKLKPLHTVGSKLKLICFQPIFMRLSSLKDEFSKSKKPSLHLIIGFHSIST